MAGVMKDLCGGQFFLGQWDFVLVTVCDFN